ncbi:MAG: NAD-dependent epimerase/dehydratase family protein, partial [Dethiobacteria bacterium]|nr:NAD-dependent epimerase/dehydratase family protein [Dethiobacteria bacterium]
MILVTGATGHLGNVLVRELVSAGEKVRVLILPGEALDSLSGLSVQVCEGDVLEQETVMKAMQEVTEVFHLAGIIAIRPGMEEVMRQVNVEGTRNVAEAALGKRVRRFVHVSSVHAFRREPLGTTIDENTPLALDSPIGSYDRTKAEGTKVILDLVERGLNAVIVCPSGLIGAHDYFDSEMGKTLVSFTANKLDFLVDGAYDFVDVRDVVAGILAARTRGLSGEVYILSGSRVTVEDLHQMAQTASGMNTAKIKVPIRLAMFAVKILQTLFQWLKIKSSYTIYSLQTLLDNSVFSSQKARTELGYTARPLNEA